MLSVAEAIKSSDNLMKKYVGLLIGMSLLAVKGIGAIIDLVLIFIFVPKKIRKLAAISSGVARVRSGELSYKIDVETNSAGNPATEPGAPKVMADGQLLWRVIENLLGNVAKYALENSRVYVNISRKDGILLEIKNISKDELNISEAELMERFTRGDASRNTEGSGLGLAIARDLVHLMDGKFSITIDGDLFKASVLLQEKTK